jgi:protein-disulfide isomerase
MAFTGSLMLVPAALKAEDAAPAGFSDAQKTEIHGVIKDYLIGNPEVIVEAMQAYQVNEQKRQDEQAASKIKEHQASFSGDLFPSIGDKDADVIVVEFFDYNCGYCKKALPDIQALNAQDKKIKFVFMEMPILGPTSLEAAKWALAARKQDKYFEFHSALMSFQGEKSEEALTDMAKEIGLDLEKLKSDAGSEEIQNAINSSVEIARDIGIQGTPGFIVGDKLFRGYVGIDAMKSAVDETRKASNKG